MAGLVEGLLGNFRRDIIKIKCRTTVQRYVVMLQPKEMATIDREGSENQIFVVAEGHFTNI